jgi:hypothetical protein
LEPLFCGNDPDHKGSGQFLLSRYSEKFFVIIFYGLFDRISDISLCRKNGPDMLDPLTIIGMLEPVNVRKDVRIMTVRFLCAGSMGMGHFLMIRFKRVRQRGYFFFPYRCEDFIMSPEFVNPDKFATELTGLPVINQHPVAKKFPADRRPRGVNNADKSGPFRVLSREYTTLVGIILASVLHFFECPGKFIGILWQHVSLEEFVGNCVSAEIIVGGNLSFDVNELPETCTAFSAQVTLKFDHSTILFMTIGIIKIGK